MKSIFSILVLFVPSFFVFAQTTVQSSADLATEKELVAIAQELYDAIPIGNKPVWEKYVADDIIYTDENWRVLTKKDLLDGLMPLPKGYSGLIRIANVQSRINGDAAVLSYRALEEETIFGQKLSPTYLVTDTYFKRNGLWRMIASHVIVLPSERKSVALEPKLYQPLLGEYELTPEVTYTITVEGEQLIGQRTGRAKEELLPADANTFFRKGTIRGEKVFVHDSNGRVTQMLDRRENNDLVWNRINSKSISRQDSDPISGEWEVTFHVHNSKTPASFKLKLEGEKVTGTAYSDHTGQGTLRDGLWKDNKLSFTLDFAKHESIGITGTLKDGILVGEFRTEGFVDKWEAKKK